MARLSKPKGTRRRARAKGYKSGLEHQLHLGPMKNAEYEPVWSKVEYTIKKTYNPDFAFKSQENVVYEAKGRFRTFEEAKKYVYVKESNPHLTIRFIITDSKQRAYPQTKMSLGDWLTKHGFAWALASQIPEDWCK